jgi:hypothetical protein
MSETTVQIQSPASPMNSWPTGLGTTFQNQMGWKMDRFVEILGKIILPSATIIFCKSSIASDKDSGLVTCRTINVGISSLGILYLRFWKPLGRNAGFRMRSLSQRPAKAVYESG